MKFSLLLLLTLCACARTLTINTLPANGEVALNGQHLGPAPVVLTEQQLNVRPLRLLLYKAGYQPVCTLALEQANSAVATFNMPEAATAESHQLAYRWNQALADRTTEAFISAFYAACQEQLKQQSGTAAPPDPKQHPDPGLSPRE